MRKLSPLRRFPAARVARPVVKQALRVLTRGQTSRRSNALISRIPPDQVEPLAEDLGRLSVASYYASIKRGAENDHVSSLKGALVALKDNFLTNSSFPTTCASHILQDFSPRMDSQVNRLLKKNAMKVVAKTNMDEFGMGSHSTNTPYGAVRQGRGNLDYSVGGSSGGSAVAVADGLCHMAIGSDTGGSVRLPAAYTGIVGFKPSYGRISRHGLIPYAHSLDTVGLLAREVSDIKLLFDTLDKPDYKDPTCLSASSRARITANNNASWHRHNNESNLPRHLKNKWNKPLPIRSVVSPLQNHHKSASSAGDTTAVNKAVKKHTANKIIGIPAEYNIEEIHPLVYKAWLRTIAFLRKHGHKCIPVSLPTTKIALAAYYTLAPAEASSNLAKYDGVRYGAPRTDSEANSPLYASHRGALFGDEVQRRILLGTYTLSAGAMDNYFIQAQKVRRLVQEDFDNVFRTPHPFIDNAEGALNGVDFLLTPTAPSIPPSTKDLQNQTPFDSYANDIFTVPASLAGLPAISIPVDHERHVLNSPDSRVGMQLIGQYGSDTALLAFARHEVEKHVDPNRIVFEERIARL